MIKEIQFYTAYDVFEFLLRTISHKTNKKNKSYAYVNHLYSPFFASKKDFKLMKEIQKKGPIDYICKSDSPFDQILSKFYIGFSSKVKLGIDLEFKKEIYLVEDLIISISTSQKFIKMLDNLYFDTKSILSFNMMKFFKGFAEEKIKFDITIQKNHKKAQELRTELAKNW